MYNQAEAILSQYELEIHEVKKGRGNYICDTDQGMKAVTSFRGSNDKGMILKTFLEQLSVHNFSTEQLMLNKNGEVVTQDEVTGERFLVKDYIAGRELNTGNLEELQQAVKLLAQYHSSAEQVVLEIPDKIRVASGQVVESRMRHKRELIKAKNYIRSRKKKSEFEQLFMCSFVSMLAAMEQSLGILEKQKEAKCIFCHGDVNHHNILYENGSWKLVHFENFTYSWKTYDLANFLRKIMEKNDWNVSVGKELLRIYADTAGLDSEEQRQLYGLLLFPEKFWKITNHYMNSRKSWISGRDIDKLKKVIAQEEERLNFIQNLVSFFS